MVLRRRLAEQPDFGLAPADFLQLLDELGLHFRLCLDDALQLREQLGHDATYVRTDREISDFGIQILPGRHIDTIANQRLG